MRKAPRSGHDQAGFVRPRGFTLVELLIVMAIICVLIAVLGTVFSGIWRPSKLMKCQRNLRTIHQVLMQYAAANDGWFPSFSPYYGTNISHVYRWDDGSQPAMTPWQAMSDVAQMKQMGASADVCFCPFDANYGDADYWQIASWEDPLVFYSSWNRYHYARVDFGYYFLINRGYRGTGRLADGRQCIQKDSQGDDDLPIVADLLHYRNEGYKHGWWHGGGPEAGQGLFNSSCNTLYLGGYVILKDWEALNEQGWGTEGSAGDMWWFWLGN